MAERKETGQYYTLEIGDAASPENFTPIACITDIEPNVATKVIDGTSFCGPDYAPGFPNTTLALKGFEEYSGTNESGTTLFTLQQNKTIFDFRLVPVDAAVSGDVSYAGQGFISAWKQTYQVDTFIGFDVTIQGKGTLTQTTEP